MKPNAGGIRVQGNVADELNSGLRVGWPREFDLADLPFRNLPERERTVVQDVRISRPVLLVLIAFGQEPEFVATVVEPLARGRRKILPRELRIDEEVGMSGEGDLDQAPAVLWHDDQLHPAVRDLLRVPALVVDGLHATSVVFWRIAPAFV